MDQRTTVSCQAVFKIPSGLAIREVSETSPHGVVCCSSATFHCRGKSTEGQRVGVHCCGFIQGGAEASLGSAQCTGIMTPRGLSSGRRKVRLSG